MENRLDKLEFTLRTHRHFKRMMLEDVSEVVADKLGRIPITKELLDYAKIEKTVFIQGMISHIELWSPEIRKNYLAGLDQTLEDLAESVFIEEFGDEGNRES